MELIFSCQSYAERKKVQMATAEFCGDAISWWKQLVKSRWLDRKEPVETWHKLRAMMRREYVPRQYHKEVLRKQSETKPCSANSVQKQQGNMRSSSTGVIGLPSKTTSLFSKEDIKELSQLIRNVEKQFKQTKTTSPSSEEAQNQELFNAVSELKTAEPELTQEEQAAVPTLITQIEEQPVMDDLIPLIQDVIKEETPKETQAESGLEQIVVFDPYGFQKTFLDTFLISPFIWNKTRAMELSRHDLGMKHVVFEPGGELWIHRNNTKLIEKEAAAETFDFGDLFVNLKKEMEPKEELSRVRVLCTFRTRPPRNVYEGFRSVQECTEVSK